MHRLGMSQPHAPTPYHGGNGDGEGGGGEAAAPAGGEGGGAVGSGGEGGGGGGELGHGETATTYHTHIVPSGLPILVSCAAVISIHACPIDTN